MKRFTIDAPPNASTKSKIDAAYEREAERARAEYQAGPPAGAMTKGTKSTAATRSDDDAQPRKIDEAYEREAEKARAAYRAGPPAGARTR